MCLTAIDSIQGGTNNIYGLNELDDNAVYEYEAPQPNNGKASRRQRSKNATEPEPFYCDPDWKDPNNPHFYEYCAMRDAHLAETERVFEFSLDDDTYQSADNQSEPMYTQGATIETDVDGLFSAATNRDSDNDVHQSSNNGEENTYTLGLSVDEENTYAMGESNDFGDDEMYARASGRGMVAPKFRKQNTKE
jgi:hypothetical protein